MRLYMNMRLIVLLILRIEFNELSMKLKMLIVLLLHYHLVGIIDKEKGKFIKDSLFDNTKLFF